jgi:hypothetical protein
MVVASGGPHQGQPFETFQGWEKQKFRAEKTKFLALVVVTGGEIAKGASQCLWKWL